MMQTILSQLPPDYPWADRFHHFPQLDSTNDLLKSLAKQGAPHGTVVLADSQTNGRGRLGRSFHSPEGAGIYMSILLRPNCPPGKLMHLTCAAAVAMCDAVEASTGIRPGIKWTNDLVYEGRKLGGILTELVLNSRGGVDAAIIGIGINCCQKEADFPPEIRRMAASLQMVAGHAVSRSQVCAAMMEALWHMDTALLIQKAELMHRYRNNCVTLGKEVSVLRGEDVRHADALDIDEEGALLVRYRDGSTEYVNSGEVSIRGMYGYL